MKALKLQAFPELGSYDGLGAFKIPKGLGFKVQGSSR
jgi:hypothetical protein